MKNTIGLIILILLIIGAYFIYDSTSIESGSARDFRDFAIEDTAMIERIFMSQPNGKKVLITRKDTNKWLVNRKFVARPDAIALILKTVNDIKIRQTISSQTYNHVIKRLASGATKVEFYLKGDKKPHKTWYIGDATADNEGTYMLLEKDGKKSSTPYITHRLMERGYLGSRFFLDPILWRDRIILKTDPQKINSIEVIHHVDSLTSFKIIKDGIANFTITNLETQENWQLAPEKAIPYFKEFAAVYYEYQDVKTPQSELDSIFNSPPRHELNISIEGRPEVRIKNYYLPSAPGATLDEQPIFHHPERMYTYCSDLRENTYLIVQNLTFDRLIPDIKAFKSSTFVEK